MRIDDVLNDPETSPWLREALQAALACDPVRSANDAEVLLGVLHRRVAEGAGPAITEAPAADSRAGFPAAWIPAT
jgi:hypothetical protein